MAFNVSRKAADNFRLVRSHYLQAPLTAGTYTLFYIPRMAFAAPFYAIVETGTDLADLTVGISGDGAVADTDAIMTALELASDTVGVKTQTGGHWFTGGRGAVTVTLATNITTGKIIFFTQYTIIY